LNDSLAKYRVLSSQDHLPYLFEDISLFSHKCNTDEAFFNRPNYKTHSSVDKENLPWRFLSFHIFSLCLTLQRLPWCWIGYFMSIVQILSLYYFDGHLVPISTVLSLSSSFHSSFFVPHYLSFSSFVPCILAAFPCCSTLDDLLRSVFQFAGTVSAMSTVSLLLFNNPCVCVYLLNSNDTFSLKNFHLLREWEDKPQSGRKYLQNIYHLKDY
jgi:hypothetical protein